MGREINRKRAAAALLAAVLTVAGTAFPRAVYAAEETAAEETAVWENGTSVTIDMDGLTAVQLGEGQHGNPYNVYESLNTPAQITRQGDYYFIVDTYNNRVLYATDLWKPLNEWRVMACDLNLPHAIASDGEIYLVTDTDNNRVLCYEYQNGAFQNTQRFDNLGIRPHYIQYDQETDAFFVWSSMTGDMYIIKKESVSGVMYIDEIRHIYELEGFYVRSFSIEGDEILFPSGNNCYMIVADKETLAVKARYPVTADISGMAYARKIGGYYYLTVSTDLGMSHEAAKFIRTADLATLAEGQYEDITGLFSGIGVPYYIDAMGGSYYVTSHESKKSVYKFDVAEDMVVNVCTVK